MNKFGQLDRQGDVPKFKSQGHKMVKKRTISIYINNADLKTCISLPI